MSERWDVWLAKNNFANSRTHADELIKSGLVSYLQNKTWVVVHKSSQKVPDSLTIDGVRVDSGDANKFVSRGGLKLEGAIQHLGLEIKNLKVLDLGISTGGFSDCLLKGGAREVLGLDVGHHQLSPQLATHPKLKFYDGINVRNLRNLRSQISDLQSTFDLIVGDLSFISLTLIIPELEIFLNEKSQVLFLVKPQFELSPEEISKGGIVKNLDLHLKVKDKILASLLAHKYLLIEYFESPLLGKDGNKEFFVFFKK